MVTLIERIRWLKRVSSEWSKNFTCWHSYVLTCLVFRGSILIYIYIHIYIPILMMFERSRLRAVNLITFDVFRSYHNNQGSSDGYPDLAYFAAKICLAPLGHKLEQDPSILLKFCWNTPHHLVPRSLRNSTKNCIRRGCSSSGKWITWITIAYYYPQIIQRTGYFPTRLCGLP